MLTNLFAKVYIHDKGSHYFSIMKMKKKIISKKDF